jgi:hypothetical protein
LSNLDEAILKDQPSSGDILLNPALLPPLDGNTNNPLLQPTTPSPLYPILGPFFLANRILDTFLWEQQSISNFSDITPLFDYTHPSLYQYPPPSNIQKSSQGYPKLSTIKEIFTHWPQDEIDHPPVPIIETLQHFDYTNHNDLEQSWQYQEHQLPFKLTNVPELIRANEKWTDAYVAEHFDTGKANENCQESPTNFFAFYNKRLFNVETMGLPPTRNNNFSFEKWAYHARYADATQLAKNRPHFY